MPRKRIKLERERWELEDDDDFEVLSQTEPPEGMSVAAWNAMRAEKAKIKMKTTPSSRHSRFGGSFVLQNVKSISDRSLIVNKPLQVSKKCYFCRINNVRAQLLTMLD